MSYVLNYVASPVRNYVASLLVSALSKYIIGIEVNSLGILSQELNLQNVELNLSSIEEDLGVNIPFVIKSSFAKSLKIVIPWTSLLSLPIGVYIESLDVELIDKVIFVAFNNEQNPSSYSLEKTSESSEDSSTNETSSTRSLFGDRYLKRILANLSIRIDNMVIKYNHENLHTVLSSKYMEIMSSGPEDQWDYSWQEPRGTKGSIYKSINIGDFALSMDYMREKSFSNVFTVSPDIPPVEEERERLFYPSVVSDLSVHIRCMMSLWEGIIDTVLSGKTASPLTEEPESGWNFFGLLGESDINEIHDYHMHVSKNPNPDKHTIDYHLHNIHSVYDIAYYTNMIDIHIDSPVVISMNPYQLNSIIRWLDSFSQETMTPQTPLEEIPQEDEQTPKEVNLETPSSPSKPVYPVTSKFNVNTVSLWVNSISFIYYMPNTLLPLSYHQHLPSLGEDKGKDTQATLSSYAVPKSLLKPVVELSLHSLEMVCNFYDNQFYNLDVLLTLHDMSISLGEKVFIQWNEPSSKKQGVSHICMFGEKMLSNNTEHMIQSTHALYFRFKQYSSLYHDYLIDYSTKQDEILPHGCLELFINHFHLNQDKNAIPILSSVLNNIYSLHLPSSTVSDDPPSSHSDYFVQLGIEDIVVSTVTQQSSAMQLSLQSFSVLFYSNLYCTECTDDASQLILSVSLSSFSITHNLHPLLSLPSFNLFLNSDNALVACDAFIDSVLLIVDKASYNGMITAFNEYAGILSIGQLPLFEPSLMLQFTVDRCYGSLSITKTDAVVTNDSSFHVSLLLHSMSLLGDGQPIVLYPIPDQVDPLINAFEMKCDYERNKETQCIWNSALMSIDVATFMSMIEKIAGYCCSINIPTEVTPKRKISKEVRIPFIEYNINMNDLLSTVQVMNGYVNAITIRLSDSFTVVTPVVSVINTPQQDNEFSVIIKDFSLLYHQQSIVSLKDVFITLSTNNHTVHCNTSSFTLSLSNEKIHACLALIRGYQDFIVLLKKDIRSISKSIEDSEVITEDSIYLRHSIDRTNSDSKQLRKRRSSLSEQPVTSQEGDGLYKRFIAVYRLTYTIDSALIEYSMEEAHSYLIRTEKVLLFLDKNEVQFCLNTLELIQDHNSLLKSDEEAFSVVFTFSSSEVSILLNNYRCSLSMNGIKQLVDDSHSIRSLLSSVQDTSEVFLTSPHPSSEVIEPMCLTVSLGVSHCEAIFLLRQDFFYQSKLIQLQCQYNQYPSNTKDLSLIFSNVFISDSCNRLLLTDLSGQIDLSMSTTTSIQFMLTKIDCSIEQQDIEEMCSSLQEIAPLLLSSSSARSSNSSTPTSLSIVGVIPDMQFSLNNATQSLKVSLTKLQVDFQTEQEKEKDRLFSISSLTMEMNDDLCFSLSSFEPSCCICIEREYKSKEQACWYYCFLGPCYVFITPEMTSLISTSLLRLIQSIPSTMKVVTKHVIPLEEQPKTGFSVRSQSIQCRIGLSHSYSFLCACSSLSLLQSPTVCHLSLSRCCVLFDKDAPQPLPSLFDGDFVPTQMVLVNQCSVILNIDCSSVLDQSKNSLLITRSIMTDIQDLVVTIDDRVITAVAILVDAFTPSIQRIISSSESFTPSISSNDSILPLSSDEDDFSSSPSHTSFFEDSSLKPESIPLVFTLSDLRMVLQDAWPNEGELVILPSVLSKEMEESTNATHLHYPSFDYYSIVNGGVPLVPTTEEYREQVYSQNIQKTASSKTSQPTRSPYTIKMQFRFHQIARVFSLHIKHLREEWIDSLAGDGFAGVLGDHLEFDLMAWSEIRRSFNCIKSVSVPIHSIKKKFSLFGKKNESNESNEILQDTMRVTENGTEYYEMESPYSYSDRYQFCVYLRAYIPGEMSAVGGMLGVIKGVTAVMQQAVSLQYYTSPLLNQFISFNFSSNMILVNLNHSSCSSPSSSSEAIQLSVTKPKVFYRHMKDCHELVLNGTFSASTMNLTHLLIMPMIQKFNVYSSLALLQKNEFFLPSCLSCSVKTSDIDLVVNLDAALLVDHLVDSFITAWNIHNTSSPIAACSNNRITFNNNSTMDLFISQVFTDEAVLVERSTSVQYSYKLPSILQQQAPIIRFAMASLGKNGREPGAWSKGINIHSFSCEKEECIKLYLESRPSSQDREAQYEIVYVSVKNTLLQTVVTLFSPMRLLSLLNSPIEVQMRDDSRISSVVTPATTTISTYLDAVNCKDSRMAPFIPYSPFPFTMVNHFDYYERDRPENQNHIYIRLRTKSSSLWGNWLRIPDVYYGEEYRLCRIHIPIDSENNYNYCYLVNHYNEVTKVNCIELLPSILFINHTNDTLVYKHYINEGFINPGLDNTTCIDYNYMINDNVNSLLSIRPPHTLNSTCSQLDVREEKDNTFVVSIQNELRYWVEKKVLYHHRGNHYQVQAIMIHPLIYYINRIDEIIQLNYSMKTSTGIIQEQFILKPHTKDLLTLNVDGRSFSAEYTEEGEMVPISTEGIQCSFALSLFYEADTVIWSNGIPVSLDPSSFCVPLKNNCLFIPCYNCETQVNECFLPVILSTEIIEGTHYLILSPFAEIENKTEFPLQIHSVSYHYTVHPKQKKPLYTQLVKETQCSFQLCYQDGEMLSDPILIEEGTFTAVLTHFPFLVEVVISHPVNSQSFSISISPMSPPPFRIINHTPINLLMAGEGSETTICLPQHQTIDFDWCVLGNKIRKEKKVVKEGSPDSYWLQIKETNRVVMKKEPRQNCRIVFYTNYNTMAGNHGQQKLWSQPIWLNHSSSKRMKVSVEGLTQILYLYSYSFHNVGCLEIFDAVPILMLSSLHMRSIQLRHFDRTLYDNLVVTDTDTDSSVSTVSFSSVTTSTQRQSYQLFSIQQQSHTQFFGNQIVYKKGQSIHLSIDIPSVSCSVYGIPNGVYQELIHSSIQNLHFIIQQDGCHLFNEILKSLPVLQLDNLFSVLLSIDSIRVDSYIDPVKPVLQLPYQSTKTDSLRLALVLDRVKGSIPNAILLFDLYLPYMYLDITDRHWISLFQTLSSILDLSHLYSHSLHPQAPSLSLAVSPTSRRYHHLAFCNIHPVYFVLSLESNTFVSVSFQNTPLRFKVKPFTMCTGTIEDYIRSVVTSLIPSVLLQSPTFVGTLDLLGNPANIVISIYHSLIDIFVNPLNRLQNGETILSVLQGVSSSTIALLQTIVGGFLNGVSSITNNLSRNIQRLNGDDNISVASLLSSGLSIVSSVTRTKSTNYSIELLRKPRNNRSSVHMNLLYQWKLIDGGEQFLIKSSISLTVININNNWINQTEKKNSLLLVSDKSVYLYDSSMDSAGNTLYTSRYKIPFSSIVICVSLRDMADSFVLLYKINRSTELTAPSEETQTIELIDKIKMEVRDERIQSFVEDNRSTIIDLCQNSWCQRMLIVSCKEHRISDNIVKMIHL